VISLEIAIFPTLVYFAPPFGIRYRRSESKNWNDWATGLRKKCDDIFSHLIQYTNMTDRRTDRWTPDDSKDRAYA